MLAGEIKEKDKSERAWELIDKDEAENGPGQKGERNTFGTSSRQLNAPLFPPKRI